MLGLSIDATMINAANLSDGGAIISSTQAPTPEKDYRACLLAIKDVVAQFDEQSPSSGVPLSIALPGILREGRVVCTPLSWLNGKPVKTDLQAVLGRAVKITNIGASFAFYEALQGTGSGKNSVFGMHIDTYCSGGLVIGGQPVAGVNGLAGNWAHLPLPSPVPHEFEGSDCWCGRTGCAESFVSSIGLEADYEKITGNRATAVEIANAATTSDIVAESVLQVLEDRLGRITAAIITLLDPDMIVIGGAIGAMPRIFDNVPRKWPGYITLKNPATQIMPATNTSGATAAGAALLAHH